MRDVAVVAGRKSVVTRLLPAVVFVAHDVAVHTGLGIAAEIRPALAIPKRVAAQADNHSDAGSQRKPHGSSSETPTHASIVIVSRGEYRGSDGFANRAFHRADNREWRERSRPAIPDVGCRCPPQSPACRIP